jgi:glycosyltransferase involved in cell wall biosynthesis
LWLENQTLVNVEFRHVDSLHFCPPDYDQWDYIWYGYSSLYKQFPCPIGKAIIAVHDPVELFSERPDWRSDAKICSELCSTLRCARGIITISEEMRNILHDNNIRSYLIPTKSNLPLRDPAQLNQSDAFQFLNVGRIYKRKNFEQFKRLASACRSFHINSRLKHDHFASSVDSYISLLDQYPVYVCTSFQEGGPLPLMDAMHRGAVPISAPVGQVPEIITHGVNGFICSSDADFIRTLLHLSENPKDLYSLRIAALSSIARLRSHQAVSERAINFIQTL